MQLAALELCGIHKEEAYAFSHLLDALKYGPTGIALVLTFSHAINRFAVDSRSRTFQKRKARNAH